jgi:hypothetical protein
MPSDYAYRLKANQSGSGELMAKRSRINFIFWFTAIISSAVFVLAWVTYNYAHAGGEPTSFALYHFAWDNQVLLEWVMTISGPIATATVITAIALEVQRRSKPKASEPFTKQNKFNQLKRLALVIAGIPGMVLTPLLIAMPLGLVPRSNFINSFQGLLVMLTMGSLVPGILAMIALLIVATITAFQKPIDPESPSPKPQLTQISLAAAATAMPTIGLLLIWVNASKDCQVNCFIFGDPILIPLAIAYLTLWLVQAIIWFGNRNKLTK